MQTILIIEDDTFTQKLYIEKLTKRGFEVITTASGTEGLFYAKKRNPNLILLDIMLPGELNGFDVLEKLKKDEELKKIPVIMMTNLDTEEKVARQIGAEGYFVKANTNIDELVEIIKKSI